METEKKTMSDNVDYLKKRIELLEAAVGYLPDKLRKEILRRAAGHAGGKAHPKKEEDEIILKDNPDAVDVHVNALMEEISIGADQVSKPEVTEEYVRIPINDCKVTATIDIDRDRGIKALYCGEEKQVRTYLFPSDKFTMESARAWIKEHKSEKSAERITKSFETPICKIDEEKRLIYGIVLEPHAVDSQGDWESEEEIEKAAHKFMKDSRVIYKEHKTKQPNVHVVESYIAPIDMDNIKKGSWVMVTYCGEDSLWAQVKGGDFTGFSIRGYAQRQ